MIETAPKQNDEREGRVKENIDQLVAARLQASNISAAAGKWSVAWRKIKSNIQIQAAEAAWQEQRRAEQKQARAELVSLLRVLKYEIKSQIGLHIKQYEEGTPFRDLRIGLGYSPWLAAPYVEFDIYILRQSDGVRKFWISDFKSRKRLTSQPPKDTEGLSAEQVVERITGWAVDAVVEEFIGDFFDGRPVWYRRVGMALAIFAYIFLAVWAFNYGRDLDWPTSFLLALLVGLQGYLFLYAWPLVILVAIGLILYF